MLDAATGSGPQSPASVPDFGDFNCRMFDGVSELRAEIVRLAARCPARLVAGDAWDYKMKGNKPGDDIEIGELRMRWSSTQTDWIASPGSLDEAGSIHTLGPQLRRRVHRPILRFDTPFGRVNVDRDSYFDKKGKAQKSDVGRVYFDDDVLW